MLLLIPKRNLLKLTEAGETLNPAEKASQKALAEVYDCIDRRQSFLVEAGAGAGKTFTLIKALHYAIDRHQHTLKKRHQKIACITYTNVAKDEINARTDRNPLIHCDTIHAYLWSLVGAFQRQLRERLPDLEHWPDRVAEVGDLGQRVIEYNLGHRDINDHRVSIHHDDVLALAVGLMENSKFRRILSSKYPIVLIDEYQDTNVSWIDSVKNHMLGKKDSPQFGFFGDHWQKIYGEGCGKIEHPALTVIGKEANFRSVSTIVDALNRMRPELPQFVVDPTEHGTIRLFHSNAWTGARRSGGHWGGDLPPEMAERALDSVFQHISEDGWDLSDETTKVLMLTHRAIAAMQGYPSLPSIFANNDSFTRKNNPHIAFLADSLEPACHAFLTRKYGEMFRALGSGVPAIRAHSDKKKWFDAMGNLIELRSRGTVGDVIDYLLTARRPRLPGAVERHEAALREFESRAVEGDEAPRSIAELRALRAVPYQEITALCHYLSGHSPFETKHGVKGAEFENVLIVVGRGWNHYNFNQMFEFANDAANVPPNRRDFFERNRNLFYVSCSRAKRRLAILFTQELSAEAVQTLSDWFRHESLQALDL